MPRKNRLSAAEAAAVGVELDDILHRLAVIKGQLPPREHGAADVARRTVRPRARRAVPEFTVQATAEMLRVSESTVRLKLRAGELEHRRTPRGHLRIPGCAVLRWYEERNGPPPE